MKNKILTDKYTELYLSWNNKFIEIKEKFKDRNLSGPFLISPSNLYEKQEKKLMIIGQETKSWAGETDIILQMEATFIFNLGKEYKYKASPFWNFRKKLEETLKNDEYSTLWTNIHKYDVDGKVLDKESKEIIKETNNLLIKEIEIGKPDLCIFFTSHARDKDIKNIFKNVEFIQVEGWTIKELCILKHPLLPQKTIRTYHPNYLRMKKYEENFFNLMGEL